MGRRPSKQITMLLIIDNYDSFTYNLVQYFGELNQRSAVVRNDQIAVANIKQLAPDAIVISPGPCTPNEAGISVDVVKQYAGDIPILGVCLGHQSICQAFGAQIVRADEVVHGKVSSINHNGKGLFTNLDTPIQATRYHSLIAERDTLPENLEITAWTDDGIVMGIRHIAHSTSGVQFHPESFLTSTGHAILKNFLDENGIAA